MTDPARRAALPGGLRRRRIVRPGRRVTACRQEGGGPAVIRGGSPRDGWHLRAGGGVPGGARAGAGENATGGRRARSTATGGARAGAAENPVPPSRPGRRRAPGAWAGAAESSSSLIRRKEAPIRAAYAGRMWRIPAYGGLHRLLTILAVVLVALSGGGGHGAAMAGLTPTMICSDGAMRTVWLDAKGRIHSELMGCEAAPCLISLIQAGPPPPFARRAGSGMTGPRSWRSAMPFPLSCHRAAALLLHPSG